MCRTAGQRKVRKMKRFARPMNTSDKLFASQTWAKLSSLCQMRLRIYSGLWHGLRIAYRSDFLKDFLNFYKAVRFFGKLPSPARKECSNVPQKSLSRRFATWSTTESTTIQYLDSLKLSISAQPLGSDCMSGVFLISTTDMRSMSLRED
jgi:hypothetical protein